MSVWEDDHCENKRRRILAGCRHWHHIPWDPYVPGSARLQRKRSWRTSCTRSSMCGLPSYASLLVPWSRYNCVCERSVADSWCNEPVWSFSCVSVDDNVRVSPCLLRVRKARIQYLGGWSDCSGDSWKFIKSPLNNYIIIDSKCTVLMMCGLLHTLWPDSLLLSPNILYCHTLERQQQQHCGKCDVLFPHV